MPTLGAPADPFAAGSATFDGVNPARHAAAVAVRSRLAICLKRFDAAGLRLVVTAPSDTRVFARSLRRFPDRQIDPARHAEWETHYRLFCGSGRQPHDRGSWRILAVEEDTRVIGAITARFFCGEIVQDYLHVFGLLAGTLPVFRDQAEQAVAEAFTTGAMQGRTPSEISDWAVRPGRHAALVGVTLMRAMAALAAAFEPPLAVLAADHRRGDVARLMRRGSAPLGRAGTYALPPFVPHGSGGWLRLLLVDAPLFHSRMRTTGATELARLKLHAPIISAG